MEVTKQKNELRQYYDQHVKKYYLIVTACRMKTLSKNDYAAFMRTFSYKPLCEVPIKFHDFITTLKQEIEDYESTISTRVVLY